MGRFTGKVTVVTEAGGGIGRAAAARLAAEGASLLGPDASYVNGGIYTVDGGSMA
jgi:NADP-dependent 3-hydroxy acid dehydrogenase YdfG